MSSLDFYQQLPSYISPIAFSIGDLSVHWYSLMWLVAFATVYFLLLWRTKNKEGEYSKNFIQDIIANGLIGALVGGRLGYILFYDLQYYIAHPLQMISPYNFESGEWVGIYGMSYHGGVLGILIAVIITANSHKQNVLKFLDFLAPVVPLGYMFGRIGNFFNAELVGRATTSKLGMYFFEGDVSRYPSQLFEAFLEGLALFIILWSIRNKKFPIGYMAAFYLIGYSVTRFIVEFFREPDAHLGFIVGGYTMGQILSSIMFIAGCSLLLYVYKKSKIQ